MLRKKYTFLYVPEDHAATRELNVPRLVAVSGGAATLALLTLAAFYVFGLFHGSSWLPGGSELQRENARLSDELVQLGDKVETLRDHLNRSYRFQEMVSAAIGLDPVDPDVREAGVGGRSLAHVFVADVAAGVRPAVTLEHDLNKLLRQARIQHKGYQTLLDTLTSRQTTIDHLPSIRPVDTGWLSSTYGYRKDPFTGKSRFHRGLDYSVPSGTPVRAVAGGIILSLKHDRGLGKMIRIDHGNRITTTYAHLSDWSIRIGQRVARGEVIGRSGNTGRSTAPHLHYEVAVGGRHVNPLPYVLDNYATR
ncbi:M23 family metallopeptidase [bacterium]|nr:M23 family metallopeptidase [bacterium]MBU1074346.1 M23 family metallopeptidase [bacterium]MBU1674193.1 M23 family metallopeptidase [bacterium]